MSRSFKLPIVSTGIVGTPQMVFANLIMTIRVNKIADQPLMNLIVARGYRSTDVENIREGYRKPFVVTEEIPTHRNGHYVKLNMVAINYPNFIKNADPNVHVRVCNSTMKANAETFKEYIINVFNYMLKDTTLK